MERRKLVVFGIGNPGQKYANTYHSLGLLLADFLEKKFADELVRKTENVSEYKSRHGRDFVILKSDVYMNNSADCLRKYKYLEPSNLLVLHDELTLKKHAIQLKYGGGLAGHNGLRSINQLIGPDFTRLRIGIGYPDDDTSIDQYVLSKIDNMAGFEEAFEKAYALVNEWIYTKYVDGINMI
jgi:PTH1 family peptidyl-tRNA hydrolase